MIPATCKNGGRSYAINQTFVTADCQQRCECRWINSSVDGNSQCVPLCTNDKIVCQRRQTVEEYKQPVKGTECNCTKQRCVPGNFLFTLYFFKWLKSELPNSRCHKKCNQVLSYF